jgi:Domain of unknown function (DUF4838)/Glycosyl hydrolase family 67 N-terminus
MTLLEFHGGKLMSPRTTLLAAFSLLALTTTTRADLTIAERGKSDYRIVVPHNAIPSERYAAEELQAYLVKITGATLPIVDNQAPRTPYEIILGDDPITGTAVDRATLGTDGYILRTSGQALLIAGGRPRGTLYGVYGLLEDTLGVRWFAPRVERVPKCDRLVLPALNETHVPALEYREVYWSEVMHDADFAARHRQNGNSYGLTAKHGGRAVVYFPFVHSLDMLVPPELFKDHPEYFPLIGGQRKSGYVQRCLANPEVVKMATERVRGWLEVHPEASIISVSQNDTFNSCQCPTCKALDDAEGTPMGSFLKFVNTIADVVARERPDVKIDTLAYQYTRKPPKTLRPAANVIIRLCSIECCFAHPLDGCPAESNKRFVADIKAWQPVAPRLYIWDYTTNFSNYQMPFPNLDALQPNVQFFVKHGVKGLFEQGNYSGGGHGEMEPLRAYLLAKLLWDPNTDVKKHTDEFLRGYYGKAADAIRKYIDLTHAPARTKGLHAHIFDGPRSAYLDDRLVAAAGPLFDEAETLADNDAIRQRVQVARLPVWYLELATGRVKGDARRERLAKFLDVAHKAGISNISEGQALDNWARQMEGAK